MHEKWNIATALLEIKSQPLWIYESLQKPQLGRSPWGVI